jgi:hypothetical protein
MMIWKINLNLFWLAIVIYLIKLAEIWLIYKKAVIIEIWIMNKSLQCFLNDHTTKGGGFELCLHVYILHQKNHLHHMEVE